MDEKRFIEVIWGVKAALVAVLLYVGFQAVTSRLHLGSVLLPEAASGTEQTPDEPSAASQARTPSDYAATLQRNLFAGPDLASSRTSSNRSKMLNSLPSAEELGLKLVGTIAGPPAASLAIIRNTRSNTDGLYRIGGFVASATVESIDPDAVILRCQGRQLILRRLAGTGGDDKSDTGKREETPGPMGAAPTQGAVPPLSTQARYVEEVFHQVTIEPYVKNKQVQGMKISGLEKVPLAEMFGLRNGDIIQTINGQQLTSKQKAFQVLMKAKTQSRVDIQLVRDGKSKDLSFQI
jgi:general secretion pathway protein C